MLNAAHNFRSAPPIRLVNPTVTVFFGVYRFIFALVACRAQTIQPVATHVLVCPLCTSFLFRTSLHLFLTYCASTFDIETLVPHNIVDVSASIFGTWGGAGNRVQRLLARAVISAKAYCLGHHGAMAPKEIRLARNEACGMGKSRRADSDQDMCMRPGIVDDVFCLFSITMCMARWLCMCVKLTGVKEWFFSRDKPQVRSVLTR